jgi:hypothetical protein
MLLVVFSVPPLKSHGVIFRWVITASKTIIHIHPGMRGYVTFQAENEELNKLTFSSLLAKNLKDVKFRLHHF